MDAALMVNAVGAEVEAKNRWIHHRLTQSVADNLRRAMLSPLFAIAAMLVLLWGDVAPTALIVWSLVLVSLTLYRIWVLLGYAPPLPSTGADKMPTHFDQHRWTWPASSIAWSGLLFMYYGKVPAEDQFLCVLILLSIGGFSIFLLSARLDFFKLYVNGLVFTAIVAVLFAWIGRGDFPGHVYDLAFAALLVVFWILLRAAGNRFHTVQRRAYELQYDNEHLIASLRQQTDTAMHAVKVKNGLLANAAHDLRQPVHALAFYADWLRNEPEVSAEVVPKILAATDSVNSLFNSLFDFAKIEAGGVLPKFSKVLVSDIVNDLVVQFGPAAAAKHLKFRQRTTPAALWTDPLLIRRMVGNLLGNAIRYTTRGGVLLTTRLRPGCMWIEVWDTGAGIAPEHQGQVFQEFYKASTHEGTEDGFGLGLAIVQRLSEVLGHRVVMRSVLGRGTYLRVEVALANPGAAPAAPVAGPVA